MVFAAYWLGPQPSAPDYKFSLPNVPGEPAQLETYISGVESRHRLKPNNEARIIWADSGKAKTEYSIVYLHGFSASHLVPLRLQP